MNEQGARGRFPELRGINLKKVRITLLSLTAASGFSSPAVAQTILAEQAPLSDICVVQPLSLCTTPVIGSRQVVAITPATTTTVSSGVSRRTGSSRINFDGQLQVDGVQLQTDGFAPSLLLSSLERQFGVDVTTQFVANYDFNFGPAVAPFGQPVANSGFNFEVESLTVNAINIDYSNDEFELADGSEGSVSLIAPDPTAITNNGVTVVGRFQTNDGTITFGTLNGTATVIAQPGITSINSGGETPYDFISPFALNLDVTSTVTTQLDETGLITPTISVTDGINLNGSTITNVAAGVNAGDAVNKAQLDREATARATGDAALAAMDTQLSQRITAESASRQTLAASMASETSARLAADIDLSSRLDGFGTRLDQMDGRLDRLDDRVASSTAVASALSGNAFLPDMKFNLTANVATFDGAHAGSIQLGALVSPHVAVNAGVATGFNKRGQSAARAGVTLGW